MKADWGARGFETRTNFHGFSTFPLCCCKAEKLKMRGAVAPQMEIRANWGTLLRGAGNRVPRAYPPYLSFLLVPPYPSYPVTPGG